MTKEKVEEAAGRGCAVLYCKCDHAFQDKKHGKHKRLHNKKVLKGGTEWRCTVCGINK